MNECGLCNDVVDGAAPSVCAPMTIQLRAIIYSRATAFGGGCLIE